MGSLALLAAGIALCAAGVVALQAGRDYGASPVCAGTSGTDCRSIEQATVTSVTVETQPSRIQVNLRTDSGDTRTAWLTPGYRTSVIPTSGRPVEIEVWHQQVTKVELPGRGLVRTLQPEFDPALLIIGLVVSGAALLLGVSAWPFRAKVAP